MHKIVHPAGLLDGLNANHLRNEITNNMTEEISTIVVNFEQVTFINSSAIGTLVAMLKSIRGSGKEMVLCALNDQVKMIFELTRMDQVFKIFGTLEDCEKQLAPAS